MKTLVFATNNPNKVKEIAGMLKGLYEIKSLQDIGCHEDIPETAPTLEGNARIKSMYVWENFGLSCFADDTGLEVEALDGAPGVKSARYAGEHCDSSDNMDLLLKNLEGKDNRLARFRTVISLVQNGIETTFEGIAPGTIRTERSGSEGFGYDPIFEPDGHDITFAEMTLEEKNKISHRGKAVRELIGFLVGGA